MLTNRCSEKYMLYINDGDCPSQKCEENCLNYLNQYNYQDYYKQHPYVYPIDQTFTTAMFALRGKESEYNWDNFYCQ